MEQGREGKVSPLIDTSKIIANKLEMSMKNDEN